MKARILDTTVLRGLATGDVTAWLRGAGWALTETVTDQYFRFAKTVDGEPFEVEVPYSAALLDRPRRMAEVLETLEVAERQSQLMIVRSIRQAGMDVIRLRVVADATRDGRFPVEQGAMFFAQARDMMLAAACATLEKRSVFGKRKPTQAMDYLRTLRYGPSEEGSYIATIESPVAPELQQTLPGVDPEQPFERRVVLTLGDALRATGTAAGLASASSEIGPFAAAVDRGVNANLCDALAGMLESFESNVLEIGIEWAHSRPSARVPKCTFGRDGAPLLREAARLLKDRNPLPDFEVLGFIVKLESGDVATGGSVLVACLVEGRVRRVKAWLDGPSYVRALDAHAQVRQVAVDGELAREGAGLVLRGAHNLRIRDDAP